jgi:hypothetical protein
MSASLRQSRTALCLLALLAALALCAGLAPSAGALPHSRGRRVERIGLSMHRKLGGGGKCSAPWRLAPRRRSARLRRRVERRVVRCRRYRLAHRATASATGSQLPLYWGAWIGDQLTGEQAPWDMGAVTKFEEMVGKSVSLINFSQPFADCSSSPCSYYHFPAQEMENIRKHGSIPFFSWASDSTPTSVNEPNFQLSDVIKGTYDSFIKEFAEAAREWGHPFFLRFNWEMNGNWFPWSEGANGNQPGEFVAAWRHVHDIFTSVGATNATWVWCPYADAQHRFGPTGRFYPGNEYVDWTCLDGFNWGQNSVNPQPWRSFAQILNSNYREIVNKVAPGKPMLLAETASNGQGQSKATWIRNMFKTLATKFRRIRGLIWFDQVDRGVQWPIETSAAATRAFANGIRQPAYQANDYAALPDPAVAPPH